MAEGEVIPSKTPEGLPNLLFFDPQHFTDSFSIQEQITHILLAYREKSGFLPFVGERDIMLVQGKVLNNDILSFPKALQSLNMNVLKQINSDLGYDVWQNWDFSDSEYSMAMHLRPNSWIWLWGKLSDLDEEGCDSAGNNLSPLKDWGYWERFHTHLIREYNAYFWEQCVGMTLRDNPIPDTLGRIRQLLRHMNAVCFVPQARGYGISKTSRGTALEGETINLAELWQECFTGLQSNATKKINQKVTISCIEKDKRITIAVNWSHFGELKIFNPYAYDAKIHIGVTIEAPNHWNFGQKVRQLVNGKNYLGICFAGDSITATVFDINTIKQLPPHIETMKSGEEATYSLTIDWIEYDFDFSHKESTALDIKLPEGWD